MAFQYQKRVKVAPDTYLSIKKNGINTSIGVRDSSVMFDKAGTYLSTCIPGTGFYDRSQLGRNSVPKVNYAKPTYPQIYSKGTYTLSGILCGLAALACLTGAPIGLIGTLIFSCGVIANISNKKKYYGKNYKSEYENPSFINDAKKAICISTDERHKYILENFVNTVELIDAIDDEERIIKILNKKPQKNIDLITNHSSLLSSLTTKLADTKIDVDTSTSPEVISSYE